MCVSTARSVHSDCGTSRARQIGDHLLQFTDRIARCRRRSYTAPCRTQKQGTTGGIIRAAVPYLLLFIAVLGTTETRVTAFLGCEAKYCSDGYAAEATERASSSQRKGQRKSLDAWSALLLAVHLDALVVAVGIGAIFDFVEVSLLLVEVLGREEQPVFVSLGHADLGVFELTLNENQKPMPPMNASTAATV